MTTRISTITLVVVTLASVIGLSACGGGGSGGPPPPPPPPPGTLDSSFGVAGIVHLPPPGIATINAIAIQPDGKIVAAGLGREIGSFGGLREGSATIARYNADGTLDSAFGAGGFVEFAPPSLQVWYEFTGVALQIDGKIVAAGRTTMGYGCIVVRLNADGSLDKAFGAAGSGLVSVDSKKCNAVALQPDGKIVLAGTVAEYARNGNSWLMRLSSDGTHDTSFGGGTGEVAIAIDPSTSSLLSTIALQGDGAIVVAGTAITDLYPLPLSQAFALMRFDSVGALDPGFGAGGIVVADPGVGWVAANGIALQPDGRIIAAGGTIYSQPESYVLLVRLLPTGAFDPGFGHGGFVSTKGETPNSGGALAIALQSNGKIVTAESGFVAARYDASGALDGAFGTGGKVQPYAHGAARAVAIQSDGRVVVAGSDFVLARCFGDPGP